MGVGGTGFFAALAAQRGPPQGREQILWLWPSITSVVALIATLRLRVLYRHEPFQGLGLWQLSMADLLATTFFTGMNLTFWQWVSTEWFLTAGIATSLLAGMLFLTGTLIAARLNFKRSTLKWLFATGYVARTYGALSVGSLMVLLIVAAFFREPPFRFFYQVVFGEYRWGVWPAYVFRSGLICLPMGLAICYFLRRSTVVAVALPVRKTVA